MTFNVISKHNDSVFLFSNLVGDIYFASWNQTFFDNNLVQDKELSPKMKTRYFLDDAGDTFQNLIINRSDYLHSDNSSHDSDENTGHITLHLNYSSPNWIRPYVEIIKHDGKVAKMNMSCYNSSYYDNCCPSEIIHEKKFWNSLPAPVICQLSFKLDTCQSYKAYLGVEMNEQSIGSERCSTVYDDNFSKTKGPDDPSDDPGATTDKPSKTVVINAFR
ncbi:hypothetical protein HELRODRAFT_180040 [Helobdella robusta]|uniref:Uncharacterized protein n=1 Tax=Helobdella robusta TaxID=6412 RepID=T1FFD7_HELRO|nr:hypothetical protein HELRODRAFT_180040 [Helobdella robusta]ESN94933.1 hypothetical protein HELRODRAFT_180040 [Helobdella robusta]